MEQFIMQQNRLHMLLVSGVLLAVTTGCSSAPVEKLSNQEWCSGVQKDLRSIEVGWPVANKLPDSNQIMGIKRVFSDYAPRAEGTLGVAARAWLQGFEAAAEYLAKGDQEALQANMPADLQEQLHLANIEINNQCGWVIWE